ncbi:MAG TPA: Lrp/AsnC family transcriptional regulator [Burkholderiales bacterium]|nr:Lrp/AsnC family transcriptional regulator [Burkholderiales bacterium]
MLQLANSWQRGFPLRPRPFAEIGARAGLGEAEVLKNFVELRREGIIDRVGPVFRPNTVGASSLAAMAVPAARLASVAAFVNDQPGVNHNYEREHRINLWFVVTGATEAEVQRTLSCIESGTGLEVLRLPLLEEFHVDLGFDLDTRAVPRAPAPGRFPALSGREREIVRATAGGLPLVPEPYASVARDIGASADEVISILERMLADGRIRRIGAVVRHRRVGYEANAMVVWDVPDAAAGEIGRRLAGDAAVTLCYRRARALPDWPYNLYCMVHGLSRARALYEVKRVSTVHGLGRFPRAVLFSKRCFAQRAARYG